jgi:hypothetical protein
MAFGWGGAGLVWHLQPDELLRMAEPISTMI